jgi:hypothetical protein
LITAADCCFLDHCRFDSCNPVGNPRVSHSKSVDVLEIVRNGSYLQIDRTAAHVTDDEPVTDSKARVLCSSYRRVSKGSLSAICRVNHSREFAQVIMCCALAYLVSS